MFWMLRNEPIAFFFFSIAVLCFRTDYRHLSNEHPMLHSSQFENHWFEVLRELGATCECRYTVHSSLRNV